MLKRGALGPQGSKEDEGDFGMVSTPDDKPQRATAAQLASRKIKDVRKRRAPTPSGGASDAAPFNPFASAAPAAAPAPTPSTGFVFGQTQSQSFPGASSGPSQGGMFSSGTNGASAPAPFSFGAGSTSFGSAPPSNPFSVNTSFGGNTQSTNGFSFGGFDAGNSPAPSFGGFGGQQNTSTPASTPASGGMFGKTTAHITSPADDSMQTSPDTKPKSASIFTQKPATGGSALGNPFANLTGQSATNPFAPPKETTTEETATKPAEPQPFKPLFGGAAAASTPLGGEKDQPAASNPFANLSGQTSATSNLFAPKTPAADVTPAKPTEAAKPFGALFGSKPSSQPTEPVSNLFAPKPAEEPKASNPFANLSAPSSFNTLSTPKATGTAEGSGKTAEAQPFKPLFGTPAPSKASEAEKEPAATPAFGNMFATPKPAAEAATAKPAGDQPFKTLFGTPAPSKTAEATATPAFGNMFATPKPAAETATAKPAGDQPFKSLFGTPAPSNTPEVGKESAATPAFGNMFATPKPAADNAAGKPAEDQPFKPLFGAPATSKPVATEKEPPAAGSAFAPKATTEEQTPAPAKSVQFGSVFGASPAPSTTQATPSNPFANLSGQNAFNNPFAPKSTEQAEKSQPSKPLFGASTSFDNKNNKQAAPDSPLVNPFTATPKATNELPKESATATSTETIVKAPSQLSSDASQKSLQFSSSSSLPSSSSTSTVSNISTTPNTVLASDTFIAPDTDSLFPQTDQPASIEYPDMSLKRLFPGNAEVNPRHPHEAALLWKLRMLTESFKLEVAKCDPKTDDIDDVILVYVELRRDMGIPIGSIDPVEEAKRADLIHHDAAEEAPNGETPPQIPSPPTFTPPNLYSTNPAPAQKPSSPEKPSTGSSTSSKFAQSFSAPAAAPSAPASPAPISAVSTATPAATSTAAPSAAIPKFDGGAASATTPAIPKFGGGATSTAAPAFQIPKFGSGGGGTDFMAQFKAKAEKTAAEEKAKRKAEDFDSDEDDEEEWERKDAERQREKQAQLEAASKKRTVFIPGQGFKFVDDDAASQSTAAPTTTPAAASTPAASTPALFEAKPGPTPSIFGAPGAASSSTSVFASGQPVPASQNIFGGLKPTSPKRKASTDETDEDDAPAKRVKSTSPAPAPAGASMFGRVSAATPPAASTLFSSTTPFTPAPAKPSQPVTTAPSAPAETTGANDDEEGEPGEIFDLTRGNGGEEEETVLFEDKSRAFMLDGQWASKGTGPVRLLQHPVTKRARVVARAEPSGNVVLNALLKKEFDYSLTTNSVQFMVPEEGGKLRHWALRVKRERLQEFHDLIQKIKN